ncbi:MAG: type IV toxin-antitoxin system AbiEi family antitoxin domain-containing protein [candidate division Zixibacteria bacterium]
MSERAKKSIKRENRFDKAIKIFRRNNGLLRTSQAKSKGIHESTIYELYRRERLERISRGLFRLRDQPAVSFSDYVIISKRIPNSIICLISSLSYFELTNQIPHELYIAIKASTRIPEFEALPVIPFEYSANHFEKGVEIHKVGKVPVRIYCPERTIMDCFKYRNKIGLNIAIEALKLYRKKMPIRMDLLEKYARMNRVFRIVKPYLEAII